jgi:hypothetical protein
MPHHRTARGAARSTFVQNVMRQQPVIRSHFTNCQRRVGRSIMVQLSKLSDPATPYRKQAGCTRTGAIAGRRRRVSSQRQAHLFHARSLGPRRRHNPAFHTWGSAGTERLHLGIGIMPLPGLGAVQDQALPATTPHTRPPAALQLTWPLLFTRALHAHASHPA